MALTCFITRELNTDEITETAKKNTVTRDFFIGTFPSNILTYPLPEICCWVWNTDENNKPGQHWVGFFKRKKILYYFDSYGEPVEFYRRQYWKDFAKRNNMGFVQYTNKQRQSNISTTCGAWTLLFIYKMCYNVKNHNPSPLDLLTLFPIGGKTDNELINNEKQLKDITFNIFSNFRELYKTKCRQDSKTQKCCNYLSLIKKY